MQEYLDEYATKDLYFAAFLSVKGIPILKVEKYGNGNNKNLPNQKSTPAYFIFQGIDRCEQLEEVFWNGNGEDALVNIKDFTTTLRDLRTRAFSVSRAVSRIYNNRYEGR